MVSLAQELTNPGLLTFVTAAMNVSSDIGWSDLLENEIDIVIMDGVCGSRAAWSDMFKAVSLT